MITAFATEQETAVPISQLKASARYWRSLAHKAQLEGNADVVLVAHMNALQNENWTKDAEEKAVVV